jgi:hypothetical protein
VPGVVEVVPGRGHDIPAHDDCRACHENGSTPVLGFTALQLSDDRDPGAPHSERLYAAMVTLRTLLEDGWLASADPVLQGPPPRIPGDPDTRAALGYLTANCGHCHNERSPVATVRFPLRAPAFATGRHAETIVADLRARSTTWDLSGRPAGTSSMITPGAPDLSVLFVRMRSRRPSSQMPPLGTVVADREGLELISRWISSMTHGH